TVGAAMALEERDYLFPIHRDLGAHLAKGQSVLNILLQYLGRGNSLTRGKDSGIHVSDKSLNIIGNISHLGAMIPVAVGTALGTLGWMCVPLHRKIGNIQISTALGNGVNAKRITRKVFINQVLLMIDALRYAYLDDDVIREKVVIEGREHVDFCLSSGRGVMGITAHMNWEVLGNIPRLLGIEFCIMGDIHKNPKIQAIMEDLRFRCGYTLLPPKGGWCPR
ncbi:MAG: thiamine pyrophosphate-dependent enzyme, partial [Desulfomonilia bacterium]